MKTSFIYILFLLILIYIFTLYTNRLSNILIKNDAIISLDLYPQLKNIEQYKNIIISELNNIIDKKVWVIYNFFHKEKIIEKNYNNDEINKLFSNTPKMYLNTTIQPEWFVICLIYNTFPIIDVQKYFSKTIDLLLKIKNISNAGISCLEANGFIPPHNDEGIERYKFHLPLIIPEKCGIKINNINYDFSKPFLFDDTYTHSVWNNSNSNRFVLIIDINK